jgi:putative proteasome-type protease
MTLSFPLTWCCIQKDSFKLVEHRYEKKDLEPISSQWASALKNTLHHLPEDWMEATFSRLPPPKEAQRGDKPLS